MAIGTINSPATWYNGTPAPASWFQNVQDTVNYLYPLGVTSSTQLPLAYNYRTNVRKMWLGPNMFTVGTNWTIAAGSFTDQFQASCVNVAGSGNCLIQLPFFFNDASKYQQVTSIAVRMYKSGTATTTVTVGEMIDMSTTTPPSVSGITNATSASSGHQTISIAGLTVRQKADRYPYVSITGANNSDVVYGVLVTFDNTLVT